MSVSQEADSRAETVSGIVFFMKAAFLIQSYIFITYLLLYYMTFYSALML